MSVSLLSKEFFRVIDERVGPFDRPFQFRIFPFDAGGDLNLMTVRWRGEQFVTYVTWGFTPGQQQRRGNFGRYEL